MAYNQNADGYAVPPTSGPPCGSVDPLITGSSRSSSRSLVADPHYRSQNLAFNHVFLRERCEQFPEHVSSLINHVRRDQGVSEPEVEGYFRDKVFPRPSKQKDDDLKRDDRLPMSRHVVPSYGSSSLRISYPIPDMLYGYDRHHAFPNQQTQLISMGNGMNGTANSHGLMYPFFVIEFKSNRGDLWAGTNQCLGGSASCVNIAEGLNNQLKKCNNSNVKPIDSTAFSIVMNGEVARLYVSWKHSDSYYMQKVKSFLLQEPVHYIEFCKYVKNIIDWGRDTRLKEIRESLDTLLEESRKRTSEAAKSRPPPTEDSDSTNKSKRRKPRRAV
ncbi:hypothetical protein B0T17DRAFT_610709 [Bombardia bombarda]|uniref:DUF7924 domain-containing protein n=1 Tax=Bombardia bombarda TaxID=252184 RepID=A0AA39U578_9PEZI|nr:hypothetical protein B0T17DRAFT_610709 [Bombardia bombarda]